jgi:hypothetical protein
MAAALERTSTPGVYARGSRWVAVYLEDGRQRRRSAPTFRAAREIKIRATAREASHRAGPTLHSYALEWVDHYAGRGAHDVINDRTRREYRRLLITHALAYFAPEERLGDLDAQRLRGFVDWLCRQHGHDGRRLCDRSVHNACCRYVRAYVMPPAWGWWSATWAPRSCCRADGVGARTSATSDGS